MAEESTARKGGTFARATVMYLTTLLQFTIAGDFSCCQEKKFEYQNWLSDLKKKTKKEIDNVGLPTTPLCTTVQCRGRVREDVFWLLRTSNGLTVMLRAASSQACKYTTITQH